MGEIAWSGMTPRYRFEHGLFRPAEKPHPRGCCVFEDCGGAQVSRFDTAEKTYKRAGKPDRFVPSRSLYRCKACGRQFSVTKGTIFEDSKIPLRTWLLVAQRMCVRALIRSSGSIPGWQSFPRYDAPLFAPFLDGGKDY